MAGAGRSSPLLLWSDDGPNWQTDDIPQQAAERKV
jgi:hypothetical protein